MAADALFTTISSYKGHRGKADVYSKVMIFLCHDSGGFAREAQRHTCVQKNYKVNSHCGDCASSCEWHHCIT